MSDWVRVRVRKAYFEWAKPSSTPDTGDRIQHSSACQATRQYGLLQVKNEDRLFDENEVDQNAYRELISNDSTRCLSEWSLARAVLGVRSSTSSPSRSSAVALLPA